MVGLAVPQLVATVAVLLVSYVALGRLRVARRRRRNGCARPPRYPHKDPFFGLDLFFRNGSAYENNRYLDELTDMYDKNGNTFEALDMGKRSIYTIEPDNLRELFTSAAWGIQPIRLAAMEPFCGRGFLTVDGDLWHKSRKMFQPSFERKAIADFSALETFTQKMIDQIPRDAQTVDMQPLLSSMFINATTLFLFGESIEDLEGAEAAQVSKAFDEAMFGSGMRIALGPLDFLAKSKRWQDACRRAQSFAEAYVKTAVDHRNTDRKMPAKSILLHSLAEQTTDREHLRNELLQAFFVAQGTTANAVANTLFLVSRADGLWTILREEVRAVVGHPEAPSYEQLQRLPELRDVVNETLRLLPVLPQNNRVALQDTTLPTGGGPGGKSPIFVEKGTMASISYFNLQRRVDIWGQDAAEFKPERWKSVGQKTRPYAFLPFGAGPRQCIGKDKAFSEACYVLVRLLQKFPRLESRDQRPWQGRVQLSAQNVHGCAVGFGQ